MASLTKVLNPLSGAVRASLQAQYASVTRIPTRHAFSTLNSTLQSPEQSSSPDQREIETMTLQLLKDSLHKEKPSAANEASQRYQKIHKVGDLYHPEDLNDVRYQQRLRQRRSRATTPLQDPFEVLDLDPLHEYKNRKLLSHFVSDMGKILPREQTGLSAKNQRKLAKAIKRARAMGIMSCTSKNF